MSDSQSSRVKPSAPPPEPAARLPRTTPEAPPRVLVDYYHKMKHQRAYPLKVTWQTEHRGSPPPVDAAPLLVRPVIAGALVTPVEQTLGPSAGAVVFSVTPVALGRLPDARVELTPLAGLHTTVELPMRSVRQRLTKMLLVLTVLIPVLLLYFTKYEPLEGSRPLRGQANEFNGPRAVGPPPGGKLPTRTAPGGGGGPRNPGRNPYTQKATNTTPRLAASHGEMLEYFINDNVPEMGGITPRIAEGAGYGYELLCNISQDFPLAFYVGLFFLVLTGASWLAHLSVRGRRRSNPLPLAQRTPDNEGNPARNLANEAPDITMVEHMQG